MSTPRDEMRQNIEDRVRRAAMAVADRLESRLGSLRDRSGALLRQVSRHSGRLAHQDMVPMPAIVRETLERVGGMIEAVVGDVDESHLGEAGGWEPAATACAAAPHADATPRPAEAVLDATMDSAHAAATSTPTSAASPSKSAAPAAAGSGRSKATHRGSRPTPPSRGKGGGRRRPKGDRPS